MSMTTHVYSSSYHVANGNGVSLADGEALYVAAGATLSSGDFNAVWGTGNYHLINIYGNAVGDRSGIWLEGIGNLVRIHDGAQVHGMSGIGIALEGYAQRIHNSGYVYGAFYGVEVYATGKGDGSSIVNTGTIEGYNIGISHAADTVGNAPLDKLTLTNSGTIAAIQKGGYSFVSLDGTGLVDEIVNTGTMKGHIALSDGDDSIDTSKGIVIGTIDLGDGADMAVGSARGDTIKGGSGEDDIRGGGGKDSLDGGLGWDVAYFDDKTASVQVTFNGGSPATVKINGVVEDVISGFEGVFGGSGADKLTGDAFANVVFGGRGNDSLSGGGGHDSVSGGAGKDVLTGGSGKDQFRFDARLGASNVDTITDFLHRDDVIGLDGLIFAALTGPLTATQFRASSYGHAATTAEQRVIYDKSNGTLWYDADGKGAQAAIHFATLSNRPTDVSYNDFLRLDIA
jgi:Ca2+-binding RTX toxin-like protein